MDNLFNTDNYPEGEPKEVTAGAIFGWKRSDISEAYPVDTYSLGYRLSLQSQTGSPVIFSSSNIGNIHTVQVMGAVTSSYAPGLYLWQAEITRNSDSEKVVVDDGYITINPAIADGVDTRSHVYITLMNIRATIQGTATKDQSSYSVAGRSLSRRSIDELLMLEKEYSQRWLSEQRKKDKKPTVSTILVKMKA